MDNDDTILAYDEKLIEDHKEADDELTNDSVDEAGEGDEEISAEPLDEESHDASLAEDRDATIVMDRETIEAADGVERENPVDPYNSDELIHDSRKTAPITAVDDDALAEEQLKSEAGKEEE